MRRFIPWLILIAAAVLAVYWWRHPDDQPRWLADWIPDANDTQTVMYKWQDVNGQWHISDRPPAEGPYQEVSVRRGTNVVSGQEDGP